MRVERQWFYWDNDDVEARGLAGTRTEPRMVYTSDKESATGTLFVFTDTDEDGQEFGLQITITEVSSLPSNWILEQAQIVMDEYIENAP